MHNLNKTQTRTALRVLTELHAIAPDAVTPREASRLCEKYGVTNDRFRRVAKREQDSRLTNLAQVAVEIVKKGGK